MMTESTGLFVRTGDRELYTQRVPAIPGKPTLILVNGLSGTTEDWNAFLNPLHTQGYGSLRLDLRGQGRTLEREIQSHGGFDHAPKINEQTDDLWEVLQYYKIAAPYSIIGMSYGGGVTLNFAARFPQKIHKLILGSPYIIRLDHAFPPQRALGNQFKQIRSLGHLGKSMTDSAERWIQPWYHQWITHYMDKRFAAHVPNPVVRQAAILLTLGIMEFNAFDILTRLPPKSLHLITPENDSLVPASLYQEFWDKLPQNVGNSWLINKNSTHMVFDYHPEDIAKHVDSIFTDEKTRRD